MSDYIMHRQHEYVDRYWKNGHWNYVYQTGGGAGHMGTQSYTRSQIMTGQVERDRAKNTRSATNSVRLEYFNTGSQAARSAEHAGRRKANELDHQAWVRNFDNTSTKAGQAALRTVQAYEKASTKVAQGTTKALNSAKAVGSKVAGATKTVGSKINNAVSPSPMKTAGKAVNKAVSKIAAQGSKTANKVVRQAKVAAATQKVKGAISTAKTAGSKAISAVSRPHSREKEVSPGVANVVANKAKSAGTKVTNAVSSAAAKAKSTASSTKAAANKAATTAKKIGSSVSSTLGKYIVKRKK